MNLRPDELALYDFCLIRKTAHATSYSKYYINVRKVSVKLMKVYSQVVTKLDFQERVLTHALRTSLKKKHYVRGNNQ